MSYPSKTTSILSSTSSVILKPASFNSLTNDFVPSQKILEIQSFAQKNYVPIIRKESQEVLINLLKKFQPKNVTIDNFCS